MDKFSILISPGAGGQCEEVGSRRSHTKTAKIKYKRCKKKFLYKPLMILCAI